MPKLNAQRRAFIDAYVGEAHYSPIKAASMAGFKNPHLSGPRLAEKLSDHIDKRLSELVAGPNECMAVLTSIVRDHKHPQRIRAAELMLKAHGVIGGEVGLKDDRRALLAEIEKEVLRLGLEHAKLGYEQKRIPASVDAAGVRIVEE